MKKRHLKVTVKDAGTMYIKQSLYNALVKVAEENAKLIPAEYAAEIRADISEFEATGKSLFVE